MNIDPRFVDYDFTTDPLYNVGVLDDARTANFASGLMAYGDDKPMVPESQWKDLIGKMEAQNTGLEWLVTRIYNQGNEGSCVANACSQALEVKQAATFGKQNVIPMSAMSLYRRIGSSPSSGAMISDGMEETDKRGILPLDNERNRQLFGSAVMPNTGWRTPFPAGWEATAKRFRGYEWRVTRGIDEMVSALLCGHPIVVGRAGHSICYLRPTYSRGSLGIIYANSWGNWGFGAGGHTAGFGLDTSRLVSSSASWAFALVSVTDWRLAA